MPEKTLIELIDAVDDRTGNFDNIRDAAIILETERALLKAEISERIEELGDLEEELKEFKRLYLLEEQECDAYVKKMHAADDVIAHFGKLLADANVEMPSNIGPELMGKIADALARIATKQTYKPKPRTRKVTTEESAPLVTLN
jgi:predicted nuclease with TOPRIM domain